MKPTLLLALLLLPMLVLAQGLDDFDYIVVVGEKAPAADVVVAANFAASMKATSGVTYQSALDSQLGELNGDYDGKTIVIVDGRAETVTILGENDAAAAAYFKKQGYEVKYEEQPAPQNKQAVAPIKAAAQPDIKTETVVDAPAVIDTQIVVDTQDEPQPEPQEPAQPTPQATPKPGFFARFAAWLSDLF